MPNQNTQTGDITIPTGDELYNLLMLGIEPELTTDQLPFLDARYKDETPDQAKIRAARYEKAFAEYEKQLADYLVKLKAKIREYQHTAAKTVEHEERVKDEQQLTQLEKQMTIS